MSAPWLDVVGIGEAGLAGLAPPARATLEAAEVIMGGERFPHLSPEMTARRLPWPSPFAALIAAIRAERGRRIVLIVTGDPLWYSVGARLLKAIPGPEIRFHPHVSAFQLAAARMRWSLADVETLTLHRRPAEAVIRYFAPGARLLLLAEGAATPPAVARLLTARGYGESRLTVLGALGGAAETRIDGSAAGWAAPCPAFLTLAVECRADAGAALEAGALSDAALGGFDPAPAPVRAAALAALWPRRGEMLWALGPGAGAVAIDWMRGARDAEALATGPADLAEIAALHGAPRLQRIETVVEARAIHPCPASVFLGDPDDATVAACLGALPPLGRLLAEARDEPGAARLAAFQAVHGGALERIVCARPAAGGGWTDAPPVTHWRLVH